MSNMTVCPNPKCGKQTFKKVYHKDGTVSRRCSTCHYETNRVYPQGFIESMVATIKTRGQ